MIDRLARKRLRCLLSDLASGGITNDTFDDSLPRSADPAILGLSGAAWHFYADLYEHRLTGSWALNSEGREFFDRMQRFLDSECEYLWRHPLALDRLYLPLGLLSLGLIPRFLEWLRLGRHGREAWPFHPSQWGAA